MRRLHLLEIEDQPWLPSTLRDAMTDFLGFSLRVNNPYRAIAPRLRHALVEAGTRQIVDLCSGAGGPWPKLQPLVAGDEPLAICLTDRYPNQEALRRVEAISGGAISFYPEPVDALHVPPHLRGFRTLFSGFHHFKPAQARRILADAVEQRQGIAVFEATQRSVPAILAIMLSPLLVLLVTPFIRPFHWSRLFWTYVVPLVPALTLFDGLVSCLRTYTPDELHALTAGLDQGYSWQAGEERAPGTPLPVTFLIGWPEQ